MKIHPSAAAVREKTDRGAKTVPSAVFFPSAVLYGELLLRLFHRETAFFSMALIRILLFSAAAGLLTALILTLLPGRRVSRGLGIGLTAFCTVVLCVEHCCKSFFKTYFSVVYLGGMAGQVAGDFLDTALEVTKDGLPFILLAFVPLAVLILLRRRILPEGRPGPRRLVLLAVLAAVLQLAGVLTAGLGGDWAVYTYDFTADGAIPQFGVVTTMRLEVEYALFGMPETPLPSLDEELFQPSQPDGAGTEPGGEETREPEGEDEPAAEPPSVNYGHQVLDIDFYALAEEESDSTIAAMHRYFASLTPSQQNEYTGYFEGKNLILITAEAFSPYVISEELTPTLYKLANSGFVFTNYYQPNWGQSTTGGEFAVLTGLIPNWIGSETAFVASAENAMPTGLGWMFRSEGYTALAYHNNTYTYYERHLTHPNLGYDYTAIGNGLVLASKSWPASDLEMIQATADAYIEEYLTTGTNFHVYYMTVSGHANYSFLGNTMSAKHREEAVAAYPDASEAVQAYVACNLELEAALTALLEKLEAAGIAEDTVIVLTADHYPYALVTDEADYYAELSGIADTEQDTSRYRSSLILWCGSMEEPVTVDTPCSAIDIVPTICNLFGLEYDSRLYSGRDVFAQNYRADRASTCMPLVVFGDKSWITAAGTYTASTGVFVPSGGVEVDEGYVDAVNALVQAKYTYAKLVVEKDYYRALSP